MPVIIEIHDLKCYLFDGTLVFDGAELALESGQRVVVTGPLGSGKGRFVRLLAGLIKPPKGTVSIFGQETSKLSEDELNTLRRRMGFVLQDSTLISNLKVLENVALPLLYHSELSYDECMDKALKLLGRTGYNGGLWELPAHLPLHSRKEVAVARALSLEPEVVVCENPSTGLTADEKERVAGLMTDYQAASPDRLLVVSTTVDSDIELFEPDRVIRIMDRNFVG